MWVESCVDGSSSVWVESSRVCGSSLVSGGWSSGGWSLVAGVCGGWSLVRLWSMVTVVWWLVAGGWSLVAELESGAWCGWSLVWLEPGVHWSLVAVEPGGGSLVAGVWWPEPGGWRAWWLEPGGAGVWGRDSSIRRFRPMSRAWCRIRSPSYVSQHSTAHNERETASQPCWPPAMSAMLDVVMDARSITAWVATQISSAVGAG